MIYPPIKDVIGDESGSGIVSAIDGDSGIVVPTMAIAALMAMAALFSAIIDGDSGIVSGIVSGNDGDSGIGSAPLMAIAA